MTDTSTVDLLALVLQDTALKRKVSTNGGEYAGACPWCGGSDRFIVWPRPTDGKARFWCRQCGAAGDAIDYVMQRDGVGYKDALTRLGLALNDPTAAAPARRPAAAPAPRQENESWAAFADSWQEGADRFCGEAQDTLHSPGGAAGRDYLASRGIKLAAAAAWGLGWRTQPYFADWGPVQIYLPPGLVIPWFFLDVYWSINVRRMSSRKPKYLRPRGAANGLYVAGAFFPGVTAIMVEGEIDAVTLWQETTGLPVVIVATGSTTGARLHRWIGLLASAARLVLAFDTDPAGEKAAAYWAGVFPDAVRLLPLGHDINEMHKAGHDLRSWSRGVIYDHD